MSELDNFKVIYKLLRILEIAMDEEDFDRAEISNEALGISQARWEMIIIMLFKEGYIEGVTITNVMGKTRPGIKIKDIRITLKGLEYLEENSLMKKAANLINGISDIIP